MNVLIRFLTACLTISIFITLLMFSSSSTNAIELVGPNSKKPSQNSEIYGPVKNSDTLWRIALNNRPDNKLTIDQVMIAIFMANPQAFKNNDIHSITDGSFVTIPSAKDIASISDQDAKRRIASNEQLKTTSTPVQARPQTTPSVRPSTPTPVAVIPKAENPTVVTSPVPKVQIIETKETPVATKPQDEVEKPVKTVEQPVEIDKTAALQTHLALAMTDMQLLIKENEELRTQIAGLDEKIVEMQIQESLDIQAHNELDQLKDELDAIELAKDTEHESIFNNGWVIALLSSIPTIALLGGLFFWLSRRYKSTEEVVTPETTIPLDLDAEDELLNEEGVLSDDLDDDLLISDDDELLEIEDSDGLSELDDDGLFSDGEELLIPSDDDEDDGLFSDGEEDVDNSSILAQDDLEALLSQADDLESDPQENTDLSDEILSVDDVDLSSEEANSVPDVDDIDALLDEANDAVSSDDDIDALLDQANDAVSSDDDIDALLDQANDAVSSDDDIDALLDQANDAVSSDDDIDALLDQADDTETSDDDIQSLLDQANDVDTNDDILSEDNNESIDDLLAETDSIIDEADSDIADGETFGESIDDLLAQTDVLVEQEIVDDNNIETDDIGSLLEETNDLIEDDETDILLEETNNDSVNDIDSLLAETESLVEEDTLDDIDDQSFGENIDDLLAQTVELIEEDSIEEETLDDINIDDVDTLLAETDAIVEDAVTDLPDVDIDNIDEMLTDTDTLLDSDAAESTTSKLEELSHLDNVDQPYLMTQEQDVNFSEHETSENVDLDAVENIELESTESVELDVTENAEPETAESDELDVAENIDPETVESNDLDVAENIEPETAESDDLDIAQNIEPEPLAPSQEAKHLVDALDGMLASSNAQVNDTNTNLNELDEFITPQAIEVNDNELTDIMAEFDESNVISESDNSADSVDSLSSELDDFLANKEDVVQAIPEQAEPLIEVEQDLNEQLSKFEEENSFIDIDKLLNDSAINDQETEPYQHVDLNMGLDEFPEIIPETNGVDVDDDPNGAAKKLDLARAYLEIDDEDSALEILKQIEESGDTLQQKEAKKLLKRLKS